MTDGEKKQRTSEASAPSVNDRRSGSDAGCDGIRAEAFRAGAAAMRALCADAWPGTNAFRRLMEPKIHSDTRAPNAVRAGCNIGWNLRGEFIATLPLPGDAEWKEWSE